MNYPFEFDELLLTENVITRLRFGKYYDSCGDFGYRSLRSPGGERLMTIIEQDPKLDGCDGYSLPARYQPNVFCSHLDWSNLYFLHDLIKDSFNYEGAYEILEANARKNNMGPYWDSFIKHAQAASIWGKVE